MDIRTGFTITMSIDPKACYIALNLRDLLSSVDSRFQYNMDDIVNLGENILQYLIHPICQFLGLSLTERMSIGFPLSSINLVMDTMRLTIGLECQQQLNLYADMIAYIAFIINKPTDVSFLFEKIEIEIKGKKKYEYKLQKQFFNEKLKQFKAMTPGKHHSFSLMFKSDNPDYYPPNAKPRKLNRIIKFNNGTMIISREYPMNNSTILCDYDMTDVHVPQRGRGDIPLNECDEKTRRIVASCFSGIIKENGSNRIQFDNSHHSACLTTFESLGPWNDPTIYGPYSIANQPSLNVYIHLHQKEIVVIRNDLEQFKVARHNSIDLFTQDKIDLILGNDVIPIENMLLPEIEFALRENAYNGQPFYATLFAGFERTNRLSPNKNNKMQLRVVHGRLQIQIDYLCSQSKGVTVLKRYINIDQTCITIDYWGIKNSIQARFLRLITAIYVKIQSNSNFIAYDESLNYFLFDLNYEKIDSLFDKALQQIQHHQHRLLNLLFEYTDNEDTYYSFSSGYSHRSGISLLSWPSRTTGTKSVNCKKLIDSAVSILEEAPTTSPNVMKFDVMQTTTLNPDFYSTQQVKKF